MADRIYITALRSLQKLELQYVPKEIDRDRSPNVSPVAIVGRNTPLHHYTGGTTQITLEFDFHSDEVGREDVIRKCKWLESLAYGDGFDSPPERVRITFGRLFQNNETWIVTKVRTKMGLFMAQDGYLPKQANVSVTFALDVDYNLKTEDVQWK